MAIELITELGSKEANSYVTLEEANDYFMNTFNVDSWNLNSDDDKARSLIAATQDVDSFTFDGRKLNLNQALNFPRVAPHAVDEYYLGYVEHMFPSGIYRDWYNDNYEPIIPKNLKIAVYEQAIYFITNREQIRRRENFMNYGLTSIQLPGNTENYSQRTSRLCYKALDIIKRVSGINNSISLSRG